MTAWSIATFINEVSKAGKAAYDIATFINVWGMEQNWWPIPGESYPSGGPVHKVLDIYKWFTPDMDTISLDNYNGDAKGKEWGNVNYARDDNPLFIVESNHRLEYVPEHCGLQCHRLFYTLRANRRWFILSRGEEEN